MLSPVSRLNKVYGGGSTLRSILGMDFVARNPTKITIMLDK